MKNVFKALMAMAMVSVMALPARAAGTSTANLNVSATVVANCTISTLPVAFGSYDPIVANKSAALVGSGSVTVACTNGSAVNVTLDQGSNADAGSTAEVPVRRMADGANFLAYSLFSDVAGTAVWGGTEATSVGHTGTGTETALTVYGSVAADQNVPVGAYADTVIATVTF